MDALLKISMAAFEIIFCSFLNETNMDSVKGRGHQAPQVILATAATG
jgi:hypothetical protein